MTGIYSEIANRVSARVAAAFYGHIPNRAGFIRCPFHLGDREPSLKFFEDSGKWYCFGCGKGGTSLTFAMELFGLNAWEAAGRLNRDFRLGLPIERKQTLREAAAAGRRAEALKREREKRRREEERTAARWDIYALFDRWQREYMPQNPEAPIDPRYAMAVKGMDAILYRIDAEI